MKTEKPPRATIDFETRSECPIKSHGSWKYSLHPTTEPLCMAFRLPYWEDGRVELWHPGFAYLDIPEGDNFGALEELFCWVVDGGLVEAHGVLFEIGIWQNIMVARYGWPEVGLQQWRCSAAKAASHALPRALEDSNESMDLDVLKDMFGARIMKKMAKPRKANKSDLAGWHRMHAPCAPCDATGRVPKFGKNGNELRTRAKCPWCGGTGVDLRSDAQIPMLPTLWHEQREEMLHLWDYCKMDVLAEEALSNFLPDLNEKETEVFLLDLAINVRGFGIDTQAVSHALTLLDNEATILNAELADITGGVVEKATNRGKIIEWCASQGFELDNTQKDTIDAYLSFDMPSMTPEVRRVLEILRTLGRSSTAKYTAMQRWVCPDGRVHGGMLYWGASTGRWSGKGVQPHNFPRGTLKKDQSMDQLWADLVTLSREEIAAKYNSVMEALSNALRGVIIPSPGRQLYVADYAAIEARVVLWLAEDDEALGVFHRGEDIYCYMADDIYGYKTNKHDHPKERGVGKIAVLGLGYQMGVDKFIDTAKKGGVDIDYDFGKRVVDTYREKFWRVKRMWYDQEAAAVEAVEQQAPSSWPVQCGRVEWFVESRFLYCRLPSGRCLAYPDPEIRQKMMPWGDMKDVLTFMGVNPHNHQWQRLTTYGGMLVENQTQAVARDIMAEAMLRVESTGVYDVVASVHDELISEADLDKGDVHEYEQLLSTLPDWAEGLPVAAEGWRGLRYRK